MADESVSVDLNVQTHVTGEEQLNQLAKTLAERLSAPVEQVQAALQGLAMPPGVVRSMGTIAQRSESVKTSIGGAAGALGGFDAAAIKADSTLQQMEQRIHRITGALHALQINPTAGMSTAEAERIMRTPVSQGDRTSAYYRDVADAVLRRNRGEMLSDEHSRRLASAPADVPDHMRNFANSLQTEAAFYRMAPVVYGERSSGAVRNVDQLLDSSGHRRSVEQGAVIQSAVGADFLDFADKSIKHARRALEIYGTGPEGAFDTDTTMLNVGNLARQAQQKYGITRGLYVNPTVHGEADAVFIDPKTQRRVGIEAKSGISWDGFDTGGMSLNKLGGYYQNAVSGGGILRSMTTKFGDSPINFMYGEGATEGVVRQKLFGSSSDDRDSWIAKNKKHGLWTDAELEEAQRSTGDLADDQRRMGEFIKTMQGRVEERNKGKQTKDKGYIKLDNAGVTDTLGVSDILSAEEQEFYRRRSNGALDFSRMTAMQGAKRKDSDQYKALNKDWHDTLSTRMKRNMAEMGLDDDEADFLHRLATADTLRGTISTKAKPGKRSDAEIADALAERFGMKRGADGKFKNLKSGLLNASLYGGDQAIDAAMVAGPEREFLRGLTRNGLMDRMRAAKTAMLSKVRRGANDMNDQFRVPTPQELSPAVGAHGPPMRKASADRIAAVTDNLKRNFGPNFQVDLRGMNNGMVDAVGKMATKAVQQMPELRRNLKGIRVGTAKDFTDADDAIAKMDHRTGQIVFNPDKTSNPRKLRAELKKLQKTGALAQGENQFEALMGHELGHAMAPGGEKIANLMSAHLMGRVTDQTKNIIKAVREGKWSKALAAKVEQSLPKTNEFDDEEYLRTSSAEINDRKRKQKIAAKRGESEAATAAKAKRKTINRKSKREAAVSGDMMDERAIAKLSGDELETYIGMLKPQEQIKGYQSALKTRRQKADKARKALRGKSASIDAMQRQQANLQKNIEDAEQQLQRSDLDPAKRAEIRSQLDSDKSTATTLRAEARRAQTALQKQAQALRDLDDEIKDLTKGYTNAANSLGQAPGESDADYKERQKRVNADAEDARRYAKGIGNRRATDQKKVAAKDAELEAVQEGARTLRGKAAHVGASDDQRMKAAAAQAKALAEAEEQAAQAALELQQKQQMAAQAIRGALGNALQMGAQKLKQFGMAGIQAFDRVGALVKTATAGINQALTKTGQIVGTLAGRFLHLGKSAQGGMSAAKQNALQFYAAGFGIKQAGMSARMFGQQSLMRVNMGLQQYMEYEKNLNKASIFTGADPAVVQQMTFGLQRGKFGGMNLDMMNASDITRGVYYLGSALGEGSLDVEKFPGTGKMLATILTSAAISETDPETMIKGVLGISQQFGINPRDANDAGLVAETSRVITLLAGMSSLEIPDIIESMKMTGPRLNVLSGAKKGQGLSEALALNYFASEVGLRGSKVGRGIDQMLSYLQDPTDKIAEQTAATFGYGNLKGDAAKKKFNDLFFTKEGTLEGGVFGFLEKIMDQAGRDPQAVDKLLAMMFSQNASRVAGGVSIAQLRTNGQYQEIMDALSIGDNEAALKLLEDAYLQTSDTIAGSFQRVKNAWFQVQTRIIDSVKGPLIKAMQTFANVLFEISDVLLHNPFVGKFISGLITLGTVGAMVAGTMLSIAGGLMVFQRALMTGGGIVRIFVGAFGVLIPSLATLIPLLAAVAIGGAVLVAAWKRYGDDLKRIYASLAEDFSVKLTQKMLGAINTILPYIVAFSDAMIEFLDRLLFGYNEAGVQFEGLVSRFQRGFTAILPLIKAFASGFASGFGQAIIRAIQMIVEGVTKFADVMSRMAGSVTSLQQQGQAWTDVTSKVQMFGQIVGAVLGAILVTRLVAAIPMVNNLVTAFGKVALTAAKTAVSIVGFTVQLALMAAKYVLLTAATVAYAGAQLAVNGVKMIGFAITNLMTLATVGLTVATGGLVMLLGGLVLVIGVIAAGYLGWIAATQGLGAAQETLGRWIAKAKQFLDGLIIGLTPGIALVKGLWEAFLVVGDALTNIAQRFIGVSSGIKLLGIGVGVLISSFLLLAGASVLGAVVSAVAGIMGMFVALFGLVGLGTVPMIALAAVIVGALWAYNKWGDKLGWLGDMLSKVNDLLGGHADAILAVGAAALTANRLGGKWFGGGIPSAAGAAPTLTQSASTTTVSTGSMQLSGMSSSGKPIIMNDKGEWVYAEGTTGTETSAGSGSYGGRGKAGTTTRTVDLSGKKLQAGDAPVMNTITTPTIIGEQQKQGVKKLIGAKAAAVKNSFGTRPKFRGFGSAMQGAMTGLMVAETGKALGLPTDIMDIIGAGLAGFGVAGPWGAVGGVAGMGAYKLYKLMTAETPEKEYGFQRAESFINAPALTLDELGLQQAREAGLSAWLNLSGGDFSTIINPDDLGEKGNKASLFNMSWYKNQSSMQAKAQQVLYERFAPELGIDLSQRPTLNPTQDAQILLDLYDAAEGKYFNYDSISILPPLFQSYLDAGPDNLNGVKGDEKKFGKLLQGQKSFSSFDGQTTSLDLDQFAELYLGVDLQDSDMRDMPSYMEWAKSLEETGQYPTWFKAGELDPFELLTPEAQHRIIEMKMAADQTAFLTMVTQGVLPVNPGAIYSSAGSYYNSVTGVTRESIMQASLLTGGTPLNIDDIKVLDPTDLESGNIMRLALESLGYDTKALGLDDSAALQEYLKQLSPEVRSAVEFQSQAMVNALGSSQTDAEARGKIEAIVGGTDQFITKDMTQEQKDAKTTRVSELTSFIVAPRAEGRSVLDELGVMSLSDADPMLAKMVDYSAASADSYLAAAEIYNDLLEKATSTASGLQGSVSGADVFSQLDEEQMAAVYSSWAASNGVTFTDEQISKNNIKSTTAGDAEFQKFLAGDFIKTTKAISQGTEGLTGYDQATLTATEEEKNQLSEWITQIMDSVTSLLDEKGLSLGDILEKLNLDPNLSLQDIMRNPSSLFGVFGEMFPTLNMENNDALVSSYSAQLRQYEASVVYDDLYNDWMEKMSDSESSFYVSDPKEREKQAKAKADAEFVTKTASDGSRFTNADIPKRPGTSPEEAADLDKTVDQMKEFGKAVEESAKQFADFMANASLGQLADAFKLFGDMSKTRITLPDALINYVDTLDQNIKNVAPEGSLASGMEFIYDVVGMGGSKIDGADGNLYGDNLHQAILSSPGAKLFAEQFGIDLDTIIKDVPKFMFDPKYTAGAQASMLKTISMMDQKTYQGLDLLGGGAGFDFEAFNQYAISKIQGGEDFNLLSYLMESELLSKSEAQAKLDQAGISADTVNQDNYQIVQNQVKADTLGVPVIASETAKSVLAQLQAQQASGARVVDNGQLRLDQASIDYIYGLVESGDLTQSELVAIITALGGDPSAGIVSITDADKEKAKADGDDRVQSGTIGAESTGPDGEKITTPTTPNVFETTTYGPGDRQQGVTTQINNNELGAGAGGGGRGATGPTIPGGNGNFDPIGPNGGTGIINFPDYGNGTNLAVFNENGEVVGSIAQGTKVFLTGETRERNGNIEAKIINIAIGGETVTEGWIAIGTIEQGNVVVTDITPAGATGPLVATEREGLNLTDEYAERFGVKKGTEVNAVTNPDGSTSFTLGSEGELGGGSMSADGQTITMYRTYPVWENGKLKGVVKTTATSADGGATWSFKREFVRPNGVTSEAEVDPDVKTPEEAFNYQYNADDFSYSSGFPDQGSDPPPPPTRPPGSKDMREWEDGDYYLLGDDGDMHWYHIEKGIIKRIDGKALDPNDDIADPLPSFAQDDKGRVAQGGEENTELDAHITLTNNAEELAAAGIDPEDILTDDQGDIIRYEHVKHYYVDDRYVYSIKYYTYYGGNTGKYYGRSPIIEYVDPKLLTAPANQRNGGFYGGGPSPETVVFDTTPDGAPIDDTQVTDAQMLANGYERFAEPPEIWHSPDGGVYLKTTIRYFKWEYNDMDQKIKVFSGVERVEYTFIGALEGRTDGGVSQGSDASPTVVKTLQGRVAKDDPLRERKLAALTTGNFTYQPVGAPYVMDDGWYQDYEIVYLEVTLNPGGNPPTVTTEFDTDIVTVPLGEYLIKTDGTKVKFDSPEAQAISVKKPSTGQDVADALQKAKERKDVYYLKVTRYSEPFVDSESGDWCQMEQVTELVYDMSTGKTTIIKQDPPTKITLASVGDAKKDKTESLETGDSSTPPTNAVLVGAPEAPDSKSVRKPKGAGHGTVYEPITPITDAQKKTYASESDYMTLSFGEPFISDDKYWYQEVFAYYWKIYTYDGGRTHNQQVRGPVLYRVDKLNRAYNEQTGDYQGPANAQDPGKQEMDSDFDGIPDSTDKDIDGDGEDNGTDDDPFNPDVNSQFPDGGAQEAAQQGSSTGPSGASGSTGTNGKPTGPSGPDAGPAGVTGSYGDLIKSLDALRLSVDDLNYQLGGDPGQTGPQGGGTGPASTGATSALSTIAEQRRNNATGTTGPGGAASLFGQGSDQFFAPSMPGSLTSTALRNRLRTLLGSAGLGGFGGEGGLGVGGPLGALPATGTPITPTNNARVISLADLFGSGEQQSGGEQGGQPTIDFTEVTGELATLNASVVTLGGIMASGFAGVNGGLAVLAARLGAGMPVLVVNPVGIAGDVFVVVRGSMGTLPVFVTNQKAATGGLRSGLTMVGEAGPELVHLATGSRVYSFADTMSLLKSAALPGGRFPGGRDPWEEEQIPGGRFPGGSDPWDANQMMASADSDPALTAANLAAGVFYEMSMPASLNATVDPGSASSSDAGPITINFHGDMNIRDDRDIKKLVDEIDRELGRRHTNANRGMVPTHRTLNSFD